jgi:hypothetical protein
MPLEHKQHLILVGDVNEDQLNMQNHDFKDILLTNDMNNIINSPTRVNHNSQTLPDPIALTNKIQIFDSGVFETDNEISDHYGTFAYFKG